MDPKDYIPLFISFILGVLSTLLFKIYDFFYKKYKVNKLIDLYYIDFIDSLKIISSSQVKTHLFQSLNNTKTQCQGFKNRLSYEITYEIPYLNTNYTFELVRLINYTVNELDTLIESSSLNAIDDDDISKIFNDIESMIEKTKKEYKSNVKKYISLKSIQ
ncbi:hypothetical protein [Carnobacterium sp.]|uniref:hypothetical protein n=1 Tax=Carnobacterium sp. TaxID=48221 RepID=UPI00388D22C6